MKEIDEKSPGSAAPEMMEMKRLVEELAVLKESKRKFSEDATKIEKIKGMLTVLARKKDNDLCQMTTAKGESCSNKGKACYGQFCGTHKTVFTSESYLIARSGNMSLDEIEKEGMFNQLKQYELEKKEKELTKKLEELKKVAAQYKGDKESRFFEILNQDIKAFHTHLGDLSFNGENCKKILRNREKILEVFEEDEEHLKQKWRELLNRLAKVVEILSRISPFESIGLFHQEQKLISKKRKF